MEASETAAAPNLSSPEDEKLERTDGEIGSDSSGERTPPAKDGSVVSAMTDPASLEGPPVPALITEEETEQSQDDVPKQVILPDEDLGSDEPGLPSGASSPPLPPISTPPKGKEQPTPLVVTTTPTRANPVEPDETMSLPERPAPPVKVMESSNRSTASEADASIAVHGKTVTNIDKNNEVDEYIRSPEVQNAIVERSPGGRYVRFMEKLGSGASKDVYRAYDTQEGIEVAWNVVNLSGVPKNERNRIVNEVRLLERLHHHNIISFHGSWVNRERQEVNFVTEILSSGTLKSFINKVQVIRWKIAKRWAVQILKGLEYLHSQNPPVIHRDLKCENIFINGTSGDLRIGDLGLSTVHRNGRVLSVLGTPEFMAPDMYEENSYDEKVDVYAFGMCMLEIFTKEIPYSECNNPAQIYKKVSAGEPPEVLSRLQSKHAREFVLLCLGYRDEDGKYIRPTVAELLQHPFLVKRANDDDEVVVDPPLRERTIAEVAGESSTSAPITKRAVDSSQQQQQQNIAPPTREPSQQIVDGDVTNDTSPPPARKRLPSTASSQDEEDGDRFEEMQESEITMRKVKVLMGRGQELEEEEQEDNARGEGSAFSSDRTIDSDLQVAPLNEQAQQSQPPALQYLVAAAVIKNQNPNEPLYADDILKLVVRLPVDGQTQNVQFDFHLVEDDPVQVAKEMVQELGIPQGAVLEISETISGLACTARMNQERHAGRIQNAQGQIHTQYPQGLLPQGQHVQQQHPGQHLQHQGVMPSDHSHYQQQGGQPAHHLQQQGTISSGSSQQDLSQYQLQQPLQPQLHHGQHAHQQGSIPAGAPQQDQSHYQQQIGQAFQYVQHQGVIAGGAPQQEHLQFQQGVPQQEHSQFHQGMQPVSHQRRQFQRQDSGGSSQQGGQPTVNVPHHGLLAGGAPQEQPQYQQQQGSQPMQHPGLGMQHGGITSYPHQDRRHFEHSSAQTPQEIQQNMQHASQPHQGPDYSASSNGHPPMQPQQQIRQYSGGSEQPMQLQGQPVYTSTHGGGYVQPNVDEEGSVQQPPMQAQMPVHSNAATLQQQAQYIQTPVTSTSTAPQAYTATAGHAASGTSSQEASQAIHAQYQSAPSNLAPSTQVGPSQPSSTVQKGSTTKRPPSGRAPVAPQQQLKLIPQAHIRSEDEAAAVPPPPQDSNMSSHAIPTEQTQTLFPERSSSVSPKVAQRTTSIGGSGQTAENLRESYANGSLPSSVSEEIDSDEEDDEDISEELRKLDEDFQKNLQRAKKVFYNRMDNLQRSQVEREAQHQKTLEKHEKERAEFEKRLAQEEEQQNKRIEQLQREWDKRRESVALHKRKHHAGRLGGHGNGTQSLNDIQDPPPSAAVPSSGHFRTGSTTSSTFSLSPAMSAHKSSNDSSSGISPATTLYKGPNDSVGDGSGSGANTER